MKKMWEAASDLKSWGAAAFVAVVFFALWVLVLLRLHRQIHVEAFFHWNGAVDSLMAIIAPLAIAGRLLQTKRARQEPTT